MSVPSMVHRSGNSLIVRSVVSGDALFGSADDVEDDDVAYGGEAASAVVAADSADKELPDCKVKRNYSCPHCSFFTQNPRSFLYHLRDVHHEKVKIYECPTCLYASKHYQKLLRHTKMVHGSAPGIDATEASRKAKKRSAPISEEDNSMESVEEHDEEDVQRPTVFKCSVCAFTSKNQGQLSKHEREEHIKTKFFRCSKCTYVTHIKARFTKHVKYHSMPMIKCELCDFRTPYKWNLDRHCKNHNGHGAFRCSACNFTADIKQSLTVHEMNHHVPPVGQAVGLGVGRRRNKVGASDATAAEEAVQQQQVVKKEVKVGEEPRKSKTSHKKIKLASNHEHSSFGADFLNPDDIISHSNGKVYIKNKCRLCNYKTAWDGEMVKHERKVHNIEREEVVKPKKSRTVPSLVPIPAHSTPQRSKNPPLSVVDIPQIKEPEMSQKEINDICANSSNSALKDLASLFSSEEMFKEPKPATPVPDTNSNVQLESKQPKNKFGYFKKTNQSFFDQLNEKIGSSGNSNLICNLCGHESKCLTENALHQKSCGKEIKKMPVVVPVHNISSSRCQHCRQRCKSSTDLHIHMQTCKEYIKSLNLFQEEDELVDDSSETGELKIDEDRVEDETKPHPMENKVFIWNDIHVPMDIEVDDSNYEYTEDKIDDNVSLDLSIRTQSPGGSENSYLSQEYVNTSNNVHHHSTTTEKIPTHGNDISIAQHKRVFKCPHCTFWASTASRFHVHIVGHLNKKPFECSLCAYRSNWRWDITKHIKLKSVRDQAHESAKVLMTDETGRRNYTKYNKYLTEIPVSGDQTMDTSGGSGTRPKSHDRNSSPSTSKTDLPKMSRAADFNSLFARSSLSSNTPIKVAGDTYLTKISEKKRHNDNKRTLFKCKKCNFKDASREVLLEHVKGHYQHLQSPPTPSVSVTVTPDISLRGTSPDKDERHCRLKHSGDVRVVSNKNGQEKIEVEEQMDEPDHMDVTQDGAFKCNACPFSTDVEKEFDLHLGGHVPKPDAAKCHFCKYYSLEHEDLMQHLVLHGVSNPEEFLTKMSDRSSIDGEMKRFKCVTCPYVTNSKSQFTYHKQFHKPRGGQYTCTQCSYNVSKRHLLNQHLKIHGINVTPQKQNGEFIDLGDISDEIEEVPSYNQSFETQNFPDIPLVWVSKNGKFSKMYKCRYCPHVNLRKVNIQEHEKMHSVREKNPNSSRLSDVEHRCSECNYVCNNAGVLSSHSKVHQGQYGTVHKLVDATKTDEEEIREMSKYYSSVSNDSIDMEVEMIPSNSSGSLLYFCKECPARFLKENEFSIHRKFHGSNMNYKCEHCSFSAKQGDYIMSHQQIHHTDYQERTKMLQTMHPSSSNYPPPQTYCVKNNQGDSIWMVQENIKSEPEYESQLSRLLSKSRPIQNVPLSGTDLFQQKSEAEQKQAAVLAQLIKHEPSQSSQKSDPQFGNLIHGNPDFIYPTCLKNGRQKDKRYKCHKCPSAFEKREQYKVHLGLHGSNQQYNCEHCDYSVKYFANYAQHLKKHKMNDSAHAARIIELDDGDEEIDERIGKETEVDEAPPKLSVADQQMYTIMEQQQKSSQSPTKAWPSEEKKLFWCPNCPYTNPRKDAVDNHQKRHVSVSGTPSTYTCKHCDYSVPQSHFLKDHEKLHFAPIKTNQVEGYMICDNLKLTSEKVDENAEKRVIFEEKPKDGDAKEFLPPLNREVDERFNNNEGEKHLINIQTGEVVDTTSNSDTQSSETKEGCEKEVISQTSSDNL